MATLIFNNLFLKYLPRQAAMLKFVNNSAFFCDITSKSLKFAGILEKSTEHSNFDAGDRKYRPANYFALKRDPLLSNN